MFWLSAPGLADLGARVTGDASPEEKSMSSVIGRNVDEDRSKRRGKAGRESWEREIVEGRRARAVVVEVSERVGEMADPGAADSGGGIESAERGGGGMAVVMTPAAGSVGEVEGRGRRVAVGESETDLERARVRKDIAEASSSMRFCSARRCSSRRRCCASLRCSRRDSSRLRSR